VDPGVAVAVLAAALLHASWQALVKSSGDGVVALAGMNLVSGTLAIALLPFVKLPTPAAALVIAFSLLLHSGYKIALAQLYARADLSVGYPLARGLTPIFATAFALLFLGEVPRDGTLARVGAVSALRETSIVFAAVVGTLVLKERMTGARTLSILLVAAGAAAIALVR
jgi:drug/metabolite transporter (DMT)-like permease